MILSPSLTTADRALYTLSEQELTQLLEATVSLRDKIILELLGWCGLRNEEAATLEIARLDFPGKEIEVLGKGYHGRKKLRRVPMPDVLAAHLRAYIGRRLQGFVFKTAKGTTHGRDFIHTETVRLIVKQAGERIGFKQRCPTLRSLNPHTLRHTAALRMKRAGMSYEAIARIIGHNNVFKTVMMYGKLPESEVKAQFLGMFQPNRIQPGELVPGQIRIEVQPESSTEHGLMRKG